MYLELMREMMRGVRICCFIKGCNEFAFFLYLFLKKIGRDIDDFVFILFYIRFLLFLYDCVF